MRNPVLRRICVNRVTPHALWLWQCKSREGSVSGAGYTPAHAFKNWMASMGYFRCEAQANRELYEVRETFYQKVIKFFK